MKIPFVDLHAQYLTIKPDIDRVVADVIRQSSYIRGPYVEQFEADYARAMGAKHCVSCSDGTTAIFVAMKGLKIKPGDEVITTAHSWISTSETITQAGGRVVFCDTDMETFTINPALLESKLSSRTVGIIPVHLYGQPADMPAIMAFAKKHGLWVIEDCAQAHCATQDGRMVGSWGDASTFSFYPGKNLGAYGDAGALVTNDDQLADWCATFARHGGKGDHLMEGINSRLDGLQAAILSVKLPHLAQWTAARQSIARRYDESLKGGGDIVVPPVAADRTHVYHLYVIRTERRDALRAHLKAAGVSTVLNYPKALPFYPAYAYLGHKPSDFPVAHRHQSEILSLPIYPELTAEQQDYVVSSIVGFFEQGPTA